jgi:hypothetical protein
MIGMRCFTGKRERVSDWANVFVIVFILAMALICGPVKGTASEKPPSAEELAVHAEKLFAKGDYDTALTVFKQLAETFKGDPARLAAIQKKLMVCEQAVHPPKVVAVFAPAPTPPSEFMRALRMRPKTAAVSAPAPTPVPEAEVMSTAGRRPHPVPKPGEVLEITLKALGNFEYDQEKGGAIPADVKRLNGVKIRVRGYMIPMGPDEKSFQFALITNLDTFRRPSSPSLLIQHMIVADCPKGKAIAYYPDEIIAEGTLKVEEKRDSGYIVCIFNLDVTSVIAK